MSKTRLCIGLLTHCSDASSQRFEILKKSVDTLSIVKQGRDDVYIYVWDNNSDPGVKEYLKSRTFFDSLYFSDKNLYDLVAVHFLAEKAKLLDAPYVCHLEDDFYFYDEDFVDDCLNFLDNNEDCGYLRILKYEYDNKKIYDKFSNAKNKDSANTQRHYNNISSQSLTWEGPESIGTHKFYKNNWHWHNYANICRTEIFETIIPEHDHQPLQKLEGYMMRQYNALNLKVGVMDIGAATHLGNFNTQESERYKLFKKTGLNLDANLPTIEYGEVQKEVISMLERDNN